MEEKILEVLMSMQKENKEFRVEVNQKFDAVNQKFDAVNQKFDAVNQKFDEVNQKIDEVNKRLDTIETKLESTHSQTAHLTEFRTETNTKLDNILKEVTDVEEVTKVNCYDIAKLKACR
ncbi:MAG: hypothetical protein ACRC68_15305 [Clostridium sp.]